MVDFLYWTKPCSDLKYKENRKYDEHIPHKTQKCKGIHSTVQAEIIEIDRLYPADYKKCWELILVSLIYNEEARCAFFTYARFLIKVTSTSQTAWSDSQHF